MSHTLPPERARDHYTRPEMVVAYHQVIGSASKGAGHQFAMKLEAEFFKYVRNLRGNEKALTLTRLFEKFCDEMDMLPTPAVQVAIRRDGHTDRAQDEAREECLIAGMTYAELMTLRSRTHREITDKLALNRAITAHVAAMPQEAKVRG